MSQPFSVIDLHSHVLPLDHGCESINETLKQLALMKKCGTLTAVATPHFYPTLHTPSDFCSAVDTALDALIRIKAENNTAAPSLLVGTEVLFCRNLHKMEGLETLCVRGTKLLLLELTDDVCGDGQADAVEGLLADGYTVVLAHVDRYIKEHDNDIRELISMGALAQINAEALYSATLRKKLSYYIYDTDSVIGFGSDLHGVNKSAYRKFSKLSYRLKDAYADVMRRSEKLLLNAERII